MIWLLILLVLIAAFIAFQLGEITENTFMATVHAKRQIEQMDEMVEYLSSIQDSVEELHPDRIEAKRDEKAMLDDIYGVLSKGPIATRDEAETKENTLP